MGQVPAKNDYLIVGDGRVARHFAHYLGLEALSVARWSRRDPHASLITLAQNSNRVLLLISDSAIGAFFDEHRELLAGKSVHFSGALTWPGVAGAHPLMTFAHELYDLATYRALPFVVEAGGPTFAELLPGLRNPHHSLAADKKALYHALCVLGGNFSILLWEKVFREFAKLDLPPEILSPYRTQIECNLERVARAESATALTGPLARGDEATIRKHLAELNDDPFREVYAAFVRAYRAEKEGSK